MFRRTPRRYLPNPPDSESRARSALTTHRVDKRTSRGGRLEVSTRASRSRPVTVPVNLRDHLLSRNEDLVRHLGGPAIVQAAVTPPTENRSPATGSDTAPDQSAPQRDQPERFVQGRRQGSGKVELRCSTRVGSVRFSVQAIGRSCRDMRPARPNCLQSYCNLHCGPREHLLLSAAYEMPGNRPVGTSKHRRARNGACGADVRGAPCRMSLDGPVRQRHRSTWSSPDCPLPRTLVRPRFRGDGHVPAGGDGMVLR